MDILTVTTGTSGGEESKEDLAERARLLEEKVRRDATEIVEVLRADFPKFVLRQAREHYVVADVDLGAAKLGELKAAVKEAGEQAVAELAPRLEEWELWLDEAAVIPADASGRRSLEGNPQVHATIQGVSGYLSEVLDRFALPADVDAIVYRLPTWFIGGKLLVSLVESYWRNLEEPRSCRAALREHTVEVKRAARADAWDAA